MGTKKKASKRQHPLGDAPEGLTYHYEFKVSDRKVAHTGTLVKLKGRRGEYVFIRHTVRDDGVEWVDTLAPHGSGWTSVRPDQIVRLAPVTRVKLKKLPK